MGTYAILGDTEVDVTVGGSTYRAYAFGLVGGGNQIEARAFEDGPDDTPVVTANKSRDITLRFRFDPGAGVGDTVSISVTVGEDSNTYSANVTGTDMGVDVSGIADWGFTCRINPSGS